MNMLNFEITSLIEIYDIALQETHSICLALISQI
jgi:hypothetical protein